MKAFTAAFRRYGVENVFGQSISSMFVLATPESGIRQCTCRTENSGAVMTDAHARISYQAGVVLVQEVPGSSRDRNAFQERDHLGLFKGVCKWVRRVEDLPRIDDYVDMAFRRAMGGRPARRSRSARTQSLSYRPLDRPTANPEQIGESGA